MHELSIAVNLVRIAAEHAENQDARSVETVFVRVGPLSGVVRDALVFAFDVATSDTLLEGAVLEVDETPIVVYCPACRTENVLPAPFTFICPACGTPTGDVRSGREVELTALEIR